MPCVKVFWVYNKFGMSHGAMLLLNSTDSSYRWYLICRMKHLIKCPLEAHAYVQDTHTHTHRRLHAHISDIMNSINLLLPKQALMPFVLLAQDFDLVWASLWWLIIAVMGCRWVCVCVCVLDSLSSLAFFFLFWGFFLLLALLCSTHVSVVLLMCAKCAVKDVVYL